MSNCTVKINVDICGESALDAVTNLVVNKQVGINAACKKVAEEFNKTNEGATVKWATLKKSYQRANKSGTVSQKKITTTKPKKLEVPIVMNEIDDFPFEAEIGALKYEVKELKVEVEQLKVEAIEDRVKIDRLDKSNAEMAMILVQSESPTGMPQNFPTPQPQDSQPYSMPRAEAFLMISKHGNNMMQTSIKLDNVSNDKLFLMIKKIKQELTALTPGGIISSNIATCVDVID